ncbi:MAG: HAD-IIA family hydrolase [Actinomycetota bacterium]|nr:HAD-IIA family hydrolase [Actinomycetota bacterium]
MSHQRLQLDALVCDLDGVLYRGAEPVPGAAETISSLRAGGIRVVLATNNATKTPEQYVERLARFGVEATPEELVTSAVVTTEEIERRGWGGHSVFVIGGDGIKASLHAIGMTFLEGIDARRADVVVVSGTSEMTYDDIRTAAFAVRGGARFLATNDDSTFPAPDGLWPGAGATVAAVETASGRSAEVMGKPYRPMMQAIERRLNGRARIGVVGDQPATDLAGGRAMGWTTVLVLSGVTDETAAAAERPAPDVTVPSLVELRELLLGPD